VGAVPRRGTEGHAFVAGGYRSCDAGPRARLVTTSGPRRGAQVLPRRSDLRLVSIRGNVETRLRKLTDEGLDALVLAQAGLERLNLSQEIVELLDPAWMLPAVGQGALGLECRASDWPTRDMLRRIDNLWTRLAVFAGPEV